jgi:predicted ATP-dependent endonuclease of OLD family
VALFQNAGSDAHVSVIGIEEPEAGLHPAATAVLLDALREASESVQVVVTSNSADLLDNPEIPPMQYGPSPGRMDSRKY